MELAAVVGDENISEKDYILAGNRAKMPNFPDDYKSADAILMPGSTEEIQAIVRICNRYGIRFIPNVTGLFFTAYANREKTIILHMKRMNRIIEINEEDRYVIIEPGVRHVQLNPELMKRGLRYTIASVGPGGSVLANFTSTSGDHHTQHGNSRANRYLLGTEMVLPTGEILRTGSLQTNSGWFCPDGPGPGMRGLIKGYTGNHGQFGVITRIAIAVDTWRGPKEMSVEGISPHFSIQIPNECSKVYAFKYDDLDKVCEAIIKIGKAEIASAVLKFFYLPLILMMSESANDFWSKWNDGFHKEELTMPLIVYLSTSSQEEFAYEEMILMDIIRETGGQIIDERIRGWFDNHMDFFTIVSFLQRVLRLGGGWAPTKLSTESVSHIFEVGKSISEFITEFTDTGKLFDAPHNFQIIPMEYGHMAHIELLFMWDRTDPRSMEYVREFMQRSGETDMKHRFHSSMPGPLGPLTEVQGPLYSNYHVWLKQLKRAFDPNNVSNPQI